MSGREGPLIRIPESIRESSQRQLEQQLLESFVDHLKTIQVSEIREAVINVDYLTDLMIQAQQDQRELVFVAIGCQNWLTMPDGDPERDKFMGRLQAEQKRVVRFSQEMADFSRGLTSFNIPHRIHFSLSDIEPLIHMELHNMGITIHNPDKSVLNDNVSLLAELIQTKGGPVEPFIHSQVLKTITQAETLQEFQELIAGHSNPDYREFMDNEYEFDLKHTAPSFVGPDQLGPVWLDIQSFNFKDDVVSLAHAAQRVAPTMPLLSIFPNAGNWSSKPTPAGKFPTRLETLASLMGFDRTPEEMVDWVRKLLIP